MQFTWKPFEDPVRLLFNAQVVLLPFSGGIPYSNRSSYCGGHGLILIVPFSVMIFVDGFNHGYH